VTRGLSKGLKIDFVNPPGGIDMADQLEAFKLVTGPLDKEFPGTVIRIPFRTQEQANASEISSVTVTADNILTFFEKFQADVAESLLFMRNIERVTFSIDGKQLGETTILQVEKIREARSAVKSAIIGMNSHSGAVPYQISQKYKHNDCDIELIGAYLVQHTIFDMHAQVPNELKSWAVETKALPWIALAARLDEGCESPSYNGRIFVTLPLPVPLDYTRVNIHGAFALQRDRRHLWTDNDALGGTKLTEVDWNNFMFQVVIPVAWKQLLLELTHHGVQVTNYFPLMPVSTGSLWLNLTEAVLDQVLTERCPVWYSTTNQFLPLDEGFLDDGVNDDALLDVLERLNMPLFKQNPDQILNLLRSRRHGRTTVNATTVCSWLRQQTNPPLFSISEAMCVLQYVCRDRKLGQLYDVPVFLTHNGQLRSLSQRCATAKHGQFDSKFYVGTDEEATLFDKSGELFLALDKYPDFVSDQINAGILELSEILNVERFGVGSFKKFCAERLTPTVPFHLEYPETVKMSQFCISFKWIQSLWSWLDQNSLAQVSEAVNLQWLIPLDDGKSLCRALPHHRSG